MNDLPSGFHGAFTRSQLRSALGGRGVRTALRVHQVHKFARNVLIDAQRGFDLKTRAAAAVLVGYTAAALYGCTAALQHPIHIQVPYARRIRSRPGLVVHQGGYDDQDVGELDGLSVLVPDLVIAHLLCREFRWRALAWSRRADQSDRAARTERAQTSTGQPLRPRQGRVRRSAT